MVGVRVGIELPSVGVRFEGLEVHVQTAAAGRALPSIFNAYRNWVEVCHPLPFVIYRSTHLHVPGYRIIMHLRSLVVLVSMPHAPWLFNVLTDPSYEPVRGRTALVMRVLPSVDA